MLQESERKLSWLIPPDSVMLSAYFKPSLCTVTLGSFLYAGIPTMNTFTMCRVRATGENPVQLAAASERADQKMNRVF
jgi:hypothetical protein